jgi:hypothetical protein
LFRGRHKTPSRTGAARQVVSRSVIDIDLLQAAAERSVRQAMGEEAVIDGA